MTRPLGNPPTPRAASRESDPDEIASNAALLSMPPSRMMDPLPNCFSICDTARSRARLFSVLSSAINVLSSPMSSASNQKQFVADDSIELVRAGRILGKAAHAFAVAAFTRIQGLRRFKTFLGFSEPVHLQAQQSELVMSFTKLRIQFRGLLQTADGALMLSRAVVNRADHKMHPFLGPIRDEQVIGFFNPESELLSVRALVGVDDALHPVAKAIDFFGFQDSRIDAFLPVGFEILKIYTCRLQRICQRLDHGVIDKIAGRNALDHFHKRVDALGQRTDRIFEPADSFQ